MCYVYICGFNIQELADRYDAQIVEKQKITVFNSAFDRPILPIITENPKKRIEFFQWWLVPFWAKEEKIKFNTANARAEELFQKVSYSEPIKKRRCLIPFSAFIEWKDLNGVKHPYFIKNSRHKISSFAGIWDRWTNQKSKNILNSFSIITTKTNEFMSEISNKSFRMPLILDIKNEEKWLKAKSRNQIESLLKPFKGENLIAYPLKKGLINRESYKKFGNKIFERVD